MRLKITNYQKGQTLIEVLVSLSILVIIISTIAVLITSSLDNTQSGKSQNMATKYAQEGIEVVRGIRDTNYAQFATYSGLYCLAKNQTTLGASAPSCVVNTDQFVRSVQVQQAGCAANIARVTVTVAWSDGKCQTGTYCRMSQQVSCFSTVNPVQAP